MKDKPLRRPGKPHRDKTTERCLMKDKPDVPENHTETKQQKDVWRRTNQTPRKTTPRQNNRKMSDEGQTRHPGKPHRDKTTERWMMKEPNFLENTKEINKQQNVCWRVPDFHDNTTKSTQHKDELGNHIFTFPSNINVFHDTEVGFALPMDAW